MFTSRKTTIILRGDVYQTLKEKTGSRNISAEINKILLEHFGKTESMLGTMKKTDTSDLRDHKDRSLQKERIQEGKESYIGNS